MTNPSATLPRQSSKARNPLEVELSLRSDGTLGALSSDGITIYTLRSICGEWRCMCPGFASRETCCHSIAAANARHCFWCGAVSAAVTAYSNGFDGGTELLLCGDCFTREVK